jgi:hypothetical protein
MKTDLIPSNPLMDVLGCAVAAARRYDGKIETLQNRNTRSFMVRHVTFEWLVRVHRG